MKITDDEKQIIKMSFVAILFYTLGLATGYLIGVN